MLLNLGDFASHRCVTSESVNLNKSFSDIFVVIFVKETIEFYFLEVDFKKWRIAHTFVVYKSDDS